jgi:hypothetical protein
MYNTDFICTYSYYDPYLRNIYHTYDNYDLDDVQEFEDLSELIYRTELFKAFGFTIEEVESKDIKFNNEEILELYNNLNKHEEFMEFVKKIKQKYNYDDLETGFITLFSYDYFFLTHSCVCDLLKNGKMEEKHINFIKKAFE